MTTTQYEIERKRKVSSSRDEFVALLVQKGFAATGSLLKEIDTYYTRPDVDYMETVECLRIRERDNFAEMTYKPASTDATKLAGDMMAKEETNVTLKQVSDVAVAKKLLENVGMIELVEVNKQRQIFKHPKHLGVIVALDEVKHAGLFVEIEVISHNHASSVASIEAVEALIDVKDFPTVTLPYRDLVMDGLKEKK